MTAIKNCTPHTLNVHCADGSVREIGPSGVVPRVATVTEDAGEIDGVPVATSRLGEVTNLPEVEQGVFLVVSQVVAAAVKRADLLCPGSLVRDDKGRVVGCKGLVRPQ